MEAQGGWREGTTEAKDMTGETGPYLKTAVFCEGVIEGKDGVLSLIRVIDRLTITAAGSETPSEMPSFPRQLKMVLMFVSGRAKGSHDVEIRMDRPDAEVKPVWSGTVFLEGEDRGANIVVEMQLTFELQGLYWFGVYFDGGLMARVPFRVIYQRAGGVSAHQ